MKKLVLLTLLHFLAFHLSSQPSSNVELNMSNIIGVWQVNSPRVGNGFAECFSFFRNGTFQYQYDPSDDTRTIVSFKGKYRITQNMLYLTIISRKERIGGNIATGGSGMDEYLFVFNNDKQHIVNENNPMELDPLIISKIKKKIFLEFYINNRHYFKVSSNPVEIKNQ